MPASAQSRAARRAPALGPCLEVAGVLFTIWSNTAAVEQAPHEGSNPGATPSETAEGRRTMLGLERKCSLSRLNLPSKQARDKPHQHCPQGAYGKRRRAHSPGFGGRSLFCGCGFFGDFKMLLHACRELPEELP